MLHVFDRFGKRRTNMERMRTPRATYGWSGHHQGDVNRNNERRERNAALASEVLEAVQTIVSALTSPEGGRYAVSFSEATRAAETLPTARHIKISPAPLWDEDLKMVEACTILTGLATHEIGHTVLSEQTMGLVRRYWPGSRVADTLGNMLDDVRINGWLRRRFPGTVFAISPTFRYLVRRYDLDANPVRFDPRFDVGQRVSFAISAALYRPYLSWIGNAVTRAERLWWVEWADRAKVAVTDREIVTLLSEAIERVTPPPAPPADEPQPQSDKGDDGAEVVEGAEEPAQNGSGADDDDEEDDEPFEDESDADDAENEPTDDDDEDEQDGPDDSLGDAPDGTNDDEPESDSNDESVEVDDPSDDEPEPDDEGNSTEGDEAEEGSEAADVDKPDDVDRTDEGEETTDGEGNDEDPTDDDNVDRDDESNVDDDGSEADAEADSFDQDGDGDEDGDETDVEGDHDSEISGPIGDENPADGDDGGSSVDLSEVPPAPEPTENIDIPTLDQLNDEAPEEMSPEELMKLVNEDRQIERVQSTEGFGTIRIHIE